MRDALLRFEHPDGLRFRETERADELLAEHPLYDIEYRGVFLWFVPLKSYDIYRMRLRLDETERTVQLQEERETYLKSWTKLRHELFKGVYKMVVEKDKLWGRRADGSLGELYSYSFNSEKLKQPLRDFIAATGWSLQEKKFS